ncbi:hypothetical protein OS493_002295 [Desmophyllum pertusum]|uniref:Uncharacterized protein n=1 Tax=Desmophyllum pertusum TaxID=174260 RepID=A0A9X0CNX0_9CNID|nr:hypothetical protein OS493_002295 [Desmophyllum pertusum]
MFSPKELISVANPLHGPWSSTAKSLAFSLNGETVYVVASDPASRRGIAVQSASSGEDVLTVLAWDVSSGELKGKKIMQSSGNRLVIPVKEGVLFTTKYWKS